MPCPPLPRPPAAQGRSGGAASDSPRVRLMRANERAHELAVDLRRHRVGVDAGAGQEVTRVLHTIDARRFHLDALEAGLGELVAVFLLLEGAAPRTTTSDTANRPPGLSTRKASASTRSLSADRLITQLEMTTSTLPSGRGMCSISPLRNSTFWTLALRWFSRARASISSVISSP